MTQIAIGQIRVTSSPAIAEIVEGIAPTWHIARCAPGNESVTALYLSGRRFGVYLPVEDNWAPTKGKGEQVTKQTPLFPGYLFVFVWGLAQHLRRIRDCPGVSGFLLDAFGVPVTVPDFIIADIQRLEWKNYLSRLPRSFFRRRQQHEHWVIPLWSNRNYGFESPDAETRTGALHRALGLAQFDKRQESIPFSPR